MTAFPNTLRVRPEVLRLVPTDALSVMTMRVQAAEVWDAVRVEAAPTTRVREVKQAAMAALLPDMDDVEAFVVKLHGIEIRDESVTLEAAGVQDASTLFLMGRRRRAVR
jgi:hypothetical protein